MRKTNRNILFHLLLALALASCDSEDARPDTPINFDLSDAQAIVFKQASSDNNNINGNLFKISNNEKISAVIDSATVTFARAFSQGLYVEIRVEGTTNIRRFYVRMDNSFVEIESGIDGIYKGENENGDLLFSDISILRTGTLSIDKLQTTLDLPTVQSISGNLAIIRDNATFQIFNTVTNTQYNVNDCNGPRMEAFSGSTMAILDDCSNQILIDMSDGSRSTTNISGWNHESLSVSDGILILSQAIAETGDMNNYGLGHIGTDGNLTTLTGNIFEFASSSCMNCGDANNVLFGNDQYAIVKELNKVSVVDRNNNNTISTILDGFKVTKVSLENNLIYYLAEDNLGNPQIGIYNILNEDNQLLDSQLAFDEIQTF